MGNNVIPSWIQILAAFLTLVLSVVATLIIVFQYILQKNRWRLDLFDKRYEIYKSTMKYLSQRSETGGLTSEQLITFLRETKDMDFLFDKEIHSFLDELYNKGNKLCYLTNILKSELDDESRNKFLAQQFDINNWFVTQYDISKNLFGEYLRITKK